MGRDERVDAGDVRVDLLLRPIRRGRSRPRARLGPNPTVRRKRSCGERRGAQHFREPSVADPALELHLPEAILRVRVAEAEQAIELVRREDVRNGVGVADDLDGR